MKHAYGCVTLVIVACGSNSSLPHEMLVRADTEPAGANCPAGGVALHSGTDQNDNGMLDDNEITSTEYVCATVPGIVGNVSDFEAIGVGDHAVLQWVNPTGAAFAGVTIRRATAGYPASPSDGDAIYEGTDTTVTDMGLSVGTEYFYRAFAHDSAGVYASGVDTSVLALASGHHDPSFNGGGVVFIPPALLYSGLTTLAVDAQGRTAAAGFEQGATSGTGRGTLWQLDRAGALDPMFNGGAELTTHPPQGFAAGVLFDSMGRMLVSDNGPRVSRILPDGTRDPSFGTSGLTDLALNAGAAYLALDAMGRILMVYPIGTASWQLTRLSASGIKDTTFGTSGSVRVDQFAGASSANIYTGRVTTDGTDVLVTGYGTGPGGNFDMGVWRFDTNGAPVTGFGTNGIVEVDSIAGGVVAQGFSIVVDGMHRVIVAGSANESANTQMVLWRFTSAGVLDSTFGTGGVVVDRDAGGGAGVDYAADLVLDSSGRIVATGGTANAAGGTDVITWRFTSSGQLDTTFATNGRAIERGVDGIGSYQEGASALALDPWGRIVVGGSVGPGAGSEVAVWRYVP